MGQFRCIFFQFQECWINFATDGDFQIVIIKKLYELMRLSSLQDNFGNKSNIMS